MAGLFVRVSFGSVDLVGELIDAKKKGQLEIGPLNYVSLQRE